MEAYEICGGAEGIKKSTALITGWLEVNPPISPGALVVSLADANVCLNASVFHELTNREDGKSAPFVEGDAAASAAGKKDAVPLVLGDSLLKNVRCGIRQIFQDQLLEAYLFA